MSQNINFAQMRQILRDFYSARRDNFAITFAMAALTIISAGCTGDYNQANSGNAAMQTDASSAPPKLLPKSATATNSQLQTKACAFRRSRPVVPAHRDQCDAGA
jgi:hypothetical protein